MQPLFEIVPNFSEGRDVTVVDEAVAAVERCGLRVAHRTSDPVHHRSVLTVFGSGGQLLEAAVAVAAVTARRIDLRTHRGAHPRIGALDILPFVPIAGATVDDAAALARRAAARIWDELHIPSFFYDVASRGEPRTLADVRRGEFEGLAARALAGEQPDVGDVIAHPSAGAIAIGARPVLVAFNIVLDSADLSLGRRIARTLRERDGGLRTLRVLALALEDGRVQISCNFTDVAATPLSRVVGVVERMARRHGACVASCELIGLLPRAALVALAAHALGAEVPVIGQSAR
ncbi:MAG TPA: glutamate formimidoyltransferase [Candidatus Acidoferrales bacterium]|nr:glutamate formimidoyltransferase [Candidatus Acidoferrales bacterium]